MERTSFTTNRSWVLGLLTLVLGLAGFQQANAQCPTPTGLTTLNIGQNSASLRWTSNNTPTDNCWTITLGGVGMPVNAANCPDGGQQLFTTTVCYINNVTSFNAPVTGMTVVGTQITVSVGGLPPGTTFNWYVSETCDGFAPPNNVSACAGAATFQTLDAQYTVSATTVRPSCPFVSPGYVPNGSFTVTVTNGTTCAGTYTVNAVPVAGSGPAASTPPPTTVVTYIGFPAGNFLFANAGAGCYTVTVTETGTCNPPTDPVVLQVCVPDGIDNVQPVFYVTDVLGNILADNDPLTAAGVTRNFGNVLVPEGECGRQDEYYVFGFDNCDGFIIAGNAVTATAVTVPNTIIPGTQVSVTPDNFGFYLVDVHWSTGTSTITILARDAAGNIANNPAGLQLIMTIPDNVDPVVTILGNSQFTIPVCATSVTGVITIQVDDLCDQNNVNFANLIVNFGGATSVINFTGNNYREYLVTFPAAGNYLISASYTDAFGNQGFIDQVVQVQLAAANQPPVIQANAEVVTLTACQTSATIVYSFTISDDCAPINIAQVQFNGGGSGLPNLNGAGFFFTDPVGCATLPCNTVYFEVQGPVGPAGTYFPLITYQGITANPTITVLQNANQPADIVLPAINVTIPQCQTSVDVVIPIHIFDDCDNPVVPARASFTLGGVAIQPDFVNAAAGYFEFARTLTAANNGQLLVATYTDAQGAVRTIDALITVNAQPDAWAPIIVYPAQDIIVNLDPCGPSTALVVFEATATDNCGVASFNVTLPAGVTGATILPSAGGSRVQVAATPGTYNILLTATDIFGNVRQEDFRIIVNQAPRPQVNLACQSLINVTLNNDCQAVITPEMVLTGNFGCLTNNDFTITVVDGNVNNGNIVDGCGTFNYHVALAAPQTTVGFTGPFAAANWTTSVNTASFQPPGTASVTISPTTLTLQTLAATNAIASIAMPSAGQLSFTWNYNGPDVGFDFFLINVNAGVIVNSTTATTGNYNQAVQAGWLLVVRINDDGFLPFAPNQNTPNIATLTNFSFAPANAVNAGDFTQCWGTINAEDKTAPVLACPPNTTTATFTDDAHVITGSLSSTAPASPTINWFNYACMQEFFTAGQTVPGPYRYNTYTFTVSQNDNYTFFFNSTAFNGVAALYEGAFDPNNPCENIIAQSDDQVIFGGTIYFVVGVGFAQQNNPNFRFVQSLIPGRTYTLLTTSEGPNQVGAYSWTVRSDGAGVLVGVPTQPIGISGPLVCTDKDVLNINNLPANVPRCYKTDRNGNVIFPANPQQRQLLEQLLRVLSYTGYPNANPLTALGGSVRDNCGFIEICVADVVTDSDCGDAVITRTFTARDKQDGDYVAPNTTPCLGQPQTTVCSHTITIRKANLLDVAFPPFTAVVDCEATYPTVGNVPGGNPHPDFTGYVRVATVFGIHDLNQSYCNLAASYFDYPRAVVCQGTYKFRREWTLFNWCNPGAGRIMNQIIKVGDYTAPNLTCPVVLDPWGVAMNPILYSTTPFNCTASFTVPVAPVSDACSANGLTTLTEIVTDIQVPVYNQWGQQTGTTTQTVVVKTIPQGANRFVTGIPVGCHRFRYTATDGCGNTRVVECAFCVEDLIEPNAICDDQLNISVGGQGFSRVYAADIDEGSNDNCGPIRIEIRRRYDLNPTTCAPIAPFFGAEDNGLLPWGDWVDFSCCDVNRLVRIELRVWDDRNGDGIPGNTVGGIADNSNICWLDVLVEDKIRPFCYAPHNTAVDCDALPYDFEPTDTLQLAALFNGTNPPSAVDNCRAWVRELTPIVNLHDCGWGTITRRFQAQDASGNLSTNACNQLITIRQRHNYEIRFPRDASAICGQATPDTILATEIGCDLLAISVHDERFVASGDECYKIFRTYRVINWCEYDGQSPPVVVSRDEDCDNNPGDEHVWVLVRPNPNFNQALPNGITNQRSLVYYDRDNVETNTNPPAFTKGTQCDGLTNPTGHWINSLIDCQANRDPNTGATQQVGVAQCAVSPTEDVIRKIDSRGYWQYTQHIKVYDNVRPDITVGAFDDFCSYDSPTANDPICEGPITIPFSVNEICTPNDVTIKAFLYAFNGSTVTAATRLNPDGTRPTTGGFSVNVIRVNGSYPDYTIVSTTTQGLPIGSHRLEVHAEDGCGNVRSINIPFNVIDCKAPTPICINGLTVTLMPVDANNDGVIDGGMMAVWATDFIASDIVDCTPPIKYSIRRVGQAPDINRTGVEFTCADYVPGSPSDGTSHVVYIDAWDGAGNRDFCETYVLVQDNSGVCAVGPLGSVAGVIRTEENEPVEGVQVAVSGAMSQSDDTDGSGAYLLSGLQLLGDYTVTPLLDENYLNGVSTFDLVLISRHILGVQLLNSPYKMIAADVNSSKSITTLDLIQLRRLILAIDTEFANNTSWRFVNAAYVFPVPTNPWFEPFPEVININDLPNNLINQNFRAVKIGDVNGSAVANLSSVEDRTINGEFALNVLDETVKAGNEYVVTFTGEQMERIRGYQMTLTYDVAKLELVDIVYGAAKDENFGMRYVSEGAVTMSWNGEATSDETLFSLVFRANVEGRLSEMLGVSSRYTRAEAYNTSSDLMSVALNFGGAVVSEGFELYQNQPNPFKGQTVIGYSLPEAANVTLRIQDAAGKVLRVIRTTGVRGYNMETLNSTDLPASGVLYYTIETDGFTATKKMIIVQ